MKPFVFRKQHAMGEGLVMVGKDILEAINELEARSGHRAIMGGPCPVERVNEFDTQYLTADELAEVG